MFEIIRCEKTDFDTLAGIWERSVRASHDFLTEDTISEIRERLIPDYFPNVELFAIRCNGRISGFAGLAGDCIEMLFIDADARGTGLGSALIDFAIRQGATRVDVNEQNAAALKFYLGKGFEITGRDATDEADRPYPILHMSL